MVRVSRLLARPYCMNENFFSKKMATKTKSELEAILNNKGKYQEDALLAATWELEKRGSEEYKAVEQEIIEQKSEREERKKKESNYTDDPNAPQLYPKWSIWVISVLFTPFIGGIMMAMNFKRTENKKQIPIVLTFSIIFTVLVLVSVNYLRSEFTTSTNWTNLFNLFGGAVLSEYFWKKQIETNTKYRKRSPLIPFIISIAVTAFFIWAATLE